MDNYTYSCPWLAHACFNITEKICSLVVHLELCSLYCELLKIVKWLIIDIYKIIHSTTIIVIKCSILISTQTHLAEVLEKVVEG